MLVGALGTPARAPSFRFAPGSPMECARGKRRADASKTAPPRCHSHECAGAGAGVAGARFESLPDSAYLMWQARHRALVPLLKFSMCGTLLRLCTLWQLEQLTT